MAKALPLPSQELLHDLFDYDASTGHFYWKKRPSNRVTDLSKPAGGYQSKYILIKVEGKQLPAHRLAWMYVTGEDPGDFDVDHIDGVRDNNAFSNLQLLTRKQNVSRKHKLAGGSSKYRGVSWNKYAKKWTATVNDHHLGYYVNEKEAAVIACLYSVNVYHKGFSNYVMP